MKIDRKTWLPVAVALVLFAALSMAYFSPLLDGKRLIQGDHKTWQGGAQEIVEYREAHNGADPLWTGSMFSGMPAYQISVEWKGALLHYVDKIFHGFLPHPAGTVFLYLVAMFILLRVLKVDPWLSLVGAVAYGFSSYFIIIFEAGHNTKAAAIGYMPLVLAGMWLLLRGNKWVGLAALALFMGLEVGANHLQVTYYMGMLLLLLVAAEVVIALREKRIMDLLVRGGLGVVAMGLALMANTSVLWGTAEYGQYTTRGQSELTITPDGSSADSIRTSGLDKNYVTDWSYGLGESFSLLVPSAKGGASGYLGNDKDAMAGADPRFRRDLQQMSHYWGDQRFTSGPVYIGVVIALLMLLMLARLDERSMWWAAGALVLVPLLLQVKHPPLAFGVMAAYLLAGLVLVRNSLAYALFGAFMLTLALSWGRNYMPLTDFFLDHVPGYDKFRAVTIILVIVELAAPVLAILYLDRLLKEGGWDKAMEKRFLIPAGALALVLLLFALMPATFFDFLSSNERSQLAAQAEDPKAEAQIYEFAAALKNVRIDLFTSDAWRGFFLVAVAGGLLFAYGRKKIGRTPLIAAMGLLILVDLWSVDKRFLNNEKDQRGKLQQWEDAPASRLAYSPGRADLAILQREETPTSLAEAEKTIARMKEERQQLSGRDRVLTEGEQQLAHFGALRHNSHYRVFNLRSPFDDARTSYFHKSVGGYHGAKLKRYQELIGFHLVAEIGAIGAAFNDSATLQSVNAILAQQHVVNMLNARYLVTDPNKQPIPNMNAYGNAWFVDDLKWVKSADEEILALNDNDPRHTAIVDERWRAQLGDGPVAADSTAQVTLKSYDTDRLEYDVRSANGSVVVFSEIWYGPDWSCTIDGSPAEHACADYVLRAMRVPAGEHSIVFQVHSRSYETGNKLNLAGSLLILLLVAGTAFMQWRKERTSAAAA